LKIYVKKFQSAFPFAIHLLYDMHMEDTIASKLKDLAIQGTAAMEYMADIFGNRCDPSIQCLVDSKSKEQFNERLISVK
jgi:hypothetical protein